MDYQTAVTTQFIPRATAALQGIANGLISAGLGANRVSVTMPDTTDLRLQLTATRAGKTITAYVELTSIRTDPSRALAIFTLFIDSNGVELTTTYTPGNAQQYTIEAGVDALLAKLAELELKMPEALVKIRASLGL